MKTPLATLLGLLAAAPWAVAADPVVSLKEAARGRFHVGAALNTAQIRGTDAAGVALVLRQFDSITPENALKWQSVHRTADGYDFTLADQYVAFGQHHHLWTIGHALIWHQQTPAWVFRNAAGGDASPEELLDRLREHIRTVVGRYRGRINGWDVVNEAVRDDGQGLRTAQGWYEILGEDALLEAFQAARAADPQAELYYNDYSLEQPAKRKAVIQLLRRLRERGARIDAVGAQGHMTLAGPPVEQIEAMFRDFAAADFKLMITELDISVLPRPSGDVGADVSRRFAEDPAMNPYRDGLPAAKADELAQRYRAVFAVLVRHAATLRRVTFWGVADGDSWLNHWPIHGRTDYPLLFDRARLPKAAATAVLTELAGMHGAKSPQATGNPPQKEH